MARLAGSEGRDMRPFSTALITWGGGKFSTISRIAEALVLDLDFLSPATSKTAETASKRPRKTTARRIVGIDAPEGSCFQKNTNPKPGKSCRSCESGEAYPAAMGAVIQFGNQKVDIRRGDVASHAGIEEWLAGFLRGRSPGTRRSHGHSGVPAELHQQSVHYLSIKLGRRQPAQLRRSLTERMALAVRAVAEHGVERVGHGHQPH